VQKRKGNLSSKIIIIVMAVVLSASTSAIAETYRWTDMDGNVGYADSLQKVPPQYREAARRVDGKSSSGPRPTLQTVPSNPTGAVSPPQGDSEEIHAVWRNRMNGTRAELEQLKIQRETVQKQYDALRGERFGKVFADPEADANHRAHLADLDAQISEKERALSTTIPDEARKAGIPPGVLSQ
jgi:hypothetical protein